MFLLIEFLSSKTVAVVPEIWYANGITYWPNYKDDNRIERAVKKEEQPGEDWEKHDVRVLRSCNQYLESRQLLKKALTQNTSDLQSDEEEEEIRGRRKRKPIHFLGDTDCDTEEEVFSKKAKGSHKQPQSVNLLSLPVIPPPPSNSTVPDTPCSSTVLPSPLASLQVSCDTIEPPFTQVRSHVYKPVWRGGMSGTESIPCSAAEMQILSLLEYLKQQQDQLINKVNYLLSKCDPGDEPELLPDTIQFPLDSMSEVDDFENWLKDPANSRKRQNMISSLALIGGSETKYITWNILSHILSANIGKQISWMGANGKRMFREMAMKTLVLCAVKKNRMSRDSTDVEVAKHIIRWFNLASDRGSRKQCAR